MERACPSCGGTSLSPSQDEGFLVCDDCDEQFQGFCREEMDDEDAGHFAVFSRQSQEAAVEEKRLNSLVADARASIRAKANHSEDCTAGLFRGVVVITRAIVDSLVSGGYAPKEILGPCRSIVIHWIRMCHANGRVSARGANALDFKPHAMLAMVSLSALFVRSSLLPRDICNLAAQNKIPFLTAGVDLLAEEVMENPRLRASFTPHLVYSASDVSHLAAALASSQYAWPPLRNFFDGPRKIYVQKLFRCFPVGQPDTTIRRLAALFGLPSAFCDRVARFTELRQIATSMSRETHARQKHRQRESAAHQKLGFANRKFGVWFDNVSEADSDVVNGSPGSPILTGLSGPLESQPFQTQLCRKGEPEDDDMPNIQTQRDRKQCRDKNSAPSKKDIFSYPLPLGLSELPFTPRHGKAVALDEFPSTRSVLIDFISTARLCYGGKVHSEDDGLVDDNSSELDREWQACVAAMRRWILDGGEETQTVMWSGLSPVALTNLRSRELQAFAAEAQACTEGDVPLFLNDDSHTLQRIAKSKDPLPELPMPEQTQMAMSENIDCSLEPLRRVGNWVWDRGLEDSEFAARACAMSEYRAIDTLEGVRRESLLKIRGLVTPDMQRRGESRGLYWWTCGDLGEELWQEPAALGWMIHIATCFFSGVPALVQGSSTEDKTYGQHVARWCDVALANVCNYVDVYLGEEGRLPVDASRPHDIPDLDSYVNESALQGTGPGHRKPRSTWPNSLRTRKLP